MIYLDNAATSFPKPEAVYRAADTAMRGQSGNPGRSAHALSRAASQVIEEARLLLARLFNARHPAEILFSDNATGALNLALQGFLQPGDRVLTTQMEHNAVARPLYHLAGRGVAVAKLPTDPITGLSTQVLEQALAQSRDTAAGRTLVAVTHCCNVTGTVNDLQGLGPLCHAAGAVLLVDAAQSAGTFPIDVQAYGIDMLAFPGHKGLLGPQGTGGLYLREGIVLEPLRRGGTGSRSEFLEQPGHIPDRYESGTQNVPGLAGLTAGLRHLQKTGLQAVRAHEEALTNRLLKGLARMPAWQTYGPPADYSGPRGAVAACNLRGVEPQVVGNLLDSEYGIAGRAGLHCNPDAHRLLGTLQCGGTLRLSPGPFTTEEEIDRTLEALEAVGEALA